MRQRARWPAARPMVMETWWARRLGKRARGDGRTPSEGGEGGAHEWTLRGYGRDAESEGAGMALTLPVSEHWTRGEAGGLVSFSWGGGVKAVLASRV